MSPFEGGEVKLNKRTANYFTFILRICEQNSELTYTFIKRNYIKRMYDFYMQTSSYNIKSNEKMTYKLLEFIYLMKKVLKEKLTDEYQDNYDSMVTYFEKLFDLDFYLKMAKEDYLFDNYECMRKFVVLMCSGNL